MVHDFSIKHAARVICKEDKVKTSIRKSVKIGNNVFIGAETMILPGTVICDNCIVCGGTVIKGKTDPNGIYAGNPAKRIGCFETFEKKYID